MIYISSLPSSHLFSSFKMLSSGLNILVYSGDNDAVCATIGTQNWIYDLGFLNCHLDLI